MEKNIKYLYKYKKIKSAVDLTRILDIINKKRIYLPRYKELNDPYESFMNIIHTCDAGSSILYHAGERRDYIDELFCQYGILSLTSNCRNQVMWTMYTDYYEGICIGFEKLENAKKIKYRKKNEGLGEIYISEPHFNQQCLIDTLMVKYDVWEYEDEYRIISKDKYLNVENNIKFIILGQKLNKQIKELLYDECTRNSISVYETYISYSHNQIIIKKYGYEIQYDGSKVEDDLKDF